MDEQQWLASEDPLEMLDHLLSGAGVRARKLRLYPAACCRRIWGLLTEEGRRALELIERYAEGDASQAQAVNAYHTILATTKSLAQGSLLICSTNDVVGIRWGSESPHGLPRSTEEAAAQAALLRDIFGTSSRPPPPIPASVLHWNRGPVRQLAAAAYEHRLLPSGHLDPERLGVLADALEEAGADAELVEHLRGPGPHVRGCHVVDLLTGRE